jgi:hypothetical protein
MAHWLKEHLGLTQHPEKTHLTHWDKRSRFLGDDLRGRSNPNDTRGLRLSRPPEKEREGKAKVKRLGGYTHRPALDLCMSINALMRGWAPYFRSANNATHRFLYLTGVVPWLVAHALGRTHRVSLKRVMRTHYGVDPASGKRAVYTPGQKGKRVYLWNKPLQRQSLFHTSVAAKDVQPVPLTSGATGHSDAQRVESRSRAAQPCEHCGKYAPQPIVHHPNRRGKVHKRKLGPANVITSGHAQRVKLLCFEGHKPQHPGGWHR